MFDHVVKSFDGLLVKFFYRLLVTGPHMITDVGCVLFVLLDVSFVAVLMQHTLEGLEADWPLKALRENTGHFQGIITKL